MAIRTGGIDYEKTMQVTTTEMWAQHYQMMQNRALTPPPAKPTRVEVLEVPASTPALDKELAGRVAAMFDYQAPAQAVAKSEAEGTLRQVLNELGIRPFVKSEVTAYKDAMVKRVSNNRQRGVWKMHPLGKAITEAVPEFALHTAVRLKERLPECEIHIDRLEQVSVPDPFLVVSLHGVQEWIEVWDEPDFKGKRVV